MRCEMDTLIEVVAKVLEIDKAKISPDSSFREDLGADSLDAFSLVFEIEEECNVSLKDSDFLPGEIDTVRDIYEKLQTLEFAAVR